MMVFFYCNNTHAEENSWDELIKKANMFTQMGMYQEAIEVTKESLIFAEKKYGPDHQKTLTSKNNLAFLLSAVPPVSYN